MSIIDDRMAYNIYSDPDLSKTSKTYTCYTIDFKGVQTPIHTYWALCNFGLNFSDEVREEYPGISGGGAYAGLQNRDDGRMAIMAFWEMSYGGNKIMRASRVYPAGIESNFGGEGEGTNCIKEYEWKTGSWYRMVIKSWQDIESGKTFVGQWVCDLEAGKWTLISYFNTKLSGICLRGALSLFQENYIGGVNQYVEREFHVKNMYARDAVTDEWVSLNASNISYGGGGADNKAGGHSFGATKEYFWGISGGTTGDMTQEEYEAASIRRSRFMINQPDQPSIENIKVSYHSVFKTDDGKIGVKWDSFANTAPQLGYKITVTSGDKTQTVEATRPEVSEVVFDGIEGNIEGTITLTDIFGGETTVPFEF